MLTNGKWLLFCQHLFDLMCGLLNQFLATADNYNNHVTFHTPVFEFKIWQ